MIAMLSNLTLAEWTAWAIVVALNAYVLFGGADFGGGVWDLLASGPRREKQRSLISNAIGPIWEANHVWLIVVVVMLFSCFSPAFSAFGTVLHIPLSLMLIGIIARGTAFIFRSHSYGSRAEQRGWGRVFAVSSLITPVVLGMIVGAVVSGAVGDVLAIIGQAPAATLPTDMDYARVASSRVSFMNVYVRPWVSPFTLAVGAMTLALFSLLAAVYLTIEAEGDAELQDDFRRRALGAAAVATVAALVALALGVARGGVMVRFLTVGWTRLILAGSVLAAAAAVVALLRRYFKLARVAAAGWVTLILWGWALAQFPLIVPPSLTIDAAAAPRKTLEDTIAVLAVGSVILVPSLWYLLRVFKTGPRSGVQSNS